MPVVAPSATASRTFALFPLLSILTSEIFKTSSVCGNTIFATRIAPALNISVRFVGEEPSDKTTLAYNEAMRRVFSNNGIDFKVVPRVQKGDQVISASAVRKALADNDMETIRRMVPKTTLTYFSSEEGKRVIERIKLEDKIKELQAKEKAEKEAAAKKVEAEAKKAKK